jgi:hypothetical protein
MRSSLSVAWSLAFVAAMGAGCAGRQWPTVTAQASQRFISQERVVQSIDLLPVDLEVWTWDGNPKMEQPGALEHAAENIAVLVSGAVTNELARHGYGIGASIDADGSYDGKDGLRGQALEPDALDATVTSLSSYGLAVQQQRRGLLVPYLPARLGVQTGSDATLYVGGWAYVGEGNPDGDSNVAEGILIGLAVVAVAAVVVVGVHELSKGKGVGGAVSGVGRAAASAGGAAVRVVGRVGGGLAKAGVGLARAGGHLARGVVRAAPTMLEVADAFGRTATHLQIGIQINNGYYGGSPAYAASRPPAPPVAEAAQPPRLQRPDYRTAEGAPHSGSSRLFLEMTLIDNTTGDPLWHARQVFPASGSRPDDVAQAVGRMLATLPPAG